MWLEVVVVILEDEAQVGLELVVLAPREDDDKGGVAAVGKHMHQVGAQRRPQLKPALEAGGRQGDVEALDGGPLMVACQEDLLESGIGIVDLLNHVSGDVLVQVGQEPRGYRRPCWHRRRRGRRRRSRRRRCGLRLAHVDVGVLARTHVS